MNQKWNETMVYLIQNRIKDRVEKRVCEGSLLTQLPPTFQNDQHGN